MNRKAKYAINGAIAGTLISALVNALKQLNKMDENPEKKFDWGDLLVAGGKVALIGGVAGFVAGAIVDEVNTNTKAINTDEYLNAFVYSVQVNKNSKLYKSSERKCEEIIHFLEMEFEHELSDVPFQWGSNVKGTAIEGKSDFDIMIRFYRDSFKIVSSTYKCNFSEKTWLGVL